MKFLVLTVVALVLGVVLLVLSTGQGERSRGTVALPGETVDEPAPTRAPAQIRTAPRPDGTARPAEGRTSSGRSSIEAAPAPEARTAYEGSVLGEGGPVPGADVQLFARDAALAETRADERGVFRLAVLREPAPTLLSVRARGYVPIERTLRTKPSGARMPLGTIRLVRGRRIEGRVVDARGAAIADAEIEARPQQTGTDVLRATARGGPDGRFEIPDAPAGSLLVSARARGFGEQTVSYTSGAAPLEIQLQPGVDLVLLLRTPRGAPVAGAEVTIQPPLPQEKRTSPRTETSDAEGRVRFEGLAQPLWSVRVLHPDVRTPARSDVRADGSEQTLECAPWPGIEGVVLTPEGAPAPAGTKVHALPAAAPGDGIARLPGGHPVDPDGHFRIGGLRPGDWRVRVVAPGFAPASSNPVKLGIEGDAHVGSVVLAAAARLVLELRCQGKPAEGAEVESFPTAPRPALLWVLQPGGESDRARSDADGRVVLESLAPGSVWIAVLMEGCPPTKWGPYEVTTEEAKPITLELPRGARVSGRVLAPGGKPFAEAQLRLTDAAGELGIPPLVSDDEGRYTSAWLPAGRYRIEAFASADPTLRSGQQELELAPGQQRTLDLTL